MCIQMNVLLGARKKDTANKISHCCYFSFIQIYDPIVKSDQKQPPGQVQIPLEVLHPAL